MKVKPTFKWNTKFNIKNVGEVQQVPTNEEVVDVTEGVGFWLTRYGLAELVEEKNTEQKSQPNNTKRKPPEWVEKALKFINNKDNDLSSLISIIGQENVDFFLNNREESQIKHQSIKKLDSESLKNLENYFNS